MNVIRHQAPGIQLALQVLSSILLDCLDKTDNPYSPETQLFGYALAEQCRM